MDFCSCTFCQATLVRNRLPSSPNWAAFVPTRPSDGRTTCAGSAITLWRRSKRAMTCWMKRTWCRWAVNERGNPQANERAAATPPSGMTLQLLLCLRRPPLQVPLLPPPTLTRKRRASPSQMREQGLRKTCSESHPFELLASERSGIVKCGGGGGGEGQQQCRLKSIVLADFVQLGCVARLCLNTQQQT